MHSEMKESQQVERISSVDCINIDLDYAIRNTLVLVLAGGQGTRLGQLTQSRSKPAVEFAGNYKIIDFVLSNCINSGFKKIGILTQYKSHCLIRHLFKGWGHLNYDHDGLMEILPAAQQNGDKWYSGTADACYQNLGFIEAESPKYVMVLSGDHIYKQDYRGFLRSHLINQAQLSVSCIPVPSEEAAGQFGVMSIDDSNRVVDFQEKPTKPAALPGQPGVSLASMGNYIFNSDFLLSQLKSDALNTTSVHDFGKNIIPSVINNKGVYAYQYNQSPGANKAYWRDVGTLDSYWQAHMDLLHEDSLINIQDQNWPIFTWQPPRPPTFVHTEEAKCQSGVKVEVDKSLIACGCRLQACTISHSVVSSDCQLEDAAVVSHSVLLSGCKVGKGVRLNKVIVESGCDIPDGMQIDADDIVRRKADFTITPKGIMIVTRETIDQLITEAAQAIRLQSIDEISYHPDFMPLKDRRKHTSYLNEVSYSGAC